MRRIRRTLLAQARRSGIRIGYPCRGEGICGKCAVAVVEGADLLSSPAPDERNLLEREGCAPSTRMACLTEIGSAGWLTIKVGGGTYKLLLHRS